MNRIRLICKEADRGSLRVMSSFTKSTTFEAITDESIDWRDKDVVVIKNRRDDPCEITLKGYECHTKTSTVAVIAPARGYTRELKLGSPEEIRIRLGGGEGCTIRANGWTPPHGMGRQGAPE